MRKIILTVLDTITTEPHTQLLKINLLTILEEEGVHGFFEKLPNIQQKHESIKKTIFSIICESFHEILLFKKEFPSQNELELVIKIEVFLGALNDCVEDKNFTLEEFLFFGKSSLNFAKNLRVRDSFIENCKISIKKHLL